MNIITKVTIPISGLGVLLFLQLLVMFTITPSAFSKSGSVEFLQNLQGCGKGDTLEGVNQLKQYLQRYGYLHYSDNHAAHANDNEFDELLESAVKTYQLNYHLNTSGGLDVETIQQMMKPRCGVPDIINGATRMQSGKRNKKSKHGPPSLHTVSHYAFFPGNERWPPTQTHLTYTFGSGVEEVGLDTLRPVISRAFAKWAAVSRFTFAEAQPGTQANLVIGFERGDHGDGGVFEGPGKGLAHAFAPPTGIFHYDADERWSTNPNMDEFDLESVAVHEIGHLLGLHHSDVSEAIMAPGIRRGVQKRELTADDIEGIRVLYSLPS